MAVDTRPLSPARRLILVAVLGALFAGSLGFAQYLVSRRHEVLIVHADFPLSFSIPVHAYDHVHGLVAAWEARQGEIVRRVALVQFDADLSGPGALHERAAELFAELYGEAPEHDDRALLDDRPAIEVSGMVGQQDAAWLRLAQPIPGQAVAFSYSGPDPQPDQDSSYFNELATRHLHIRVVDAASPK
jgi:hypothetical protein